MARKSRKAAAVVTAPEIDVTCHAAVYVRLSVESKYSHSESINTQQMIIAQYLEKNPEISVYNTYIDNGATGTNFHRPAFQQMPPFLRLKSTFHLKHAPGTGNVPRAGRFIIKIFDNSL